MNAKNIEKMLYLAGGKELKKDRRTRDFISGQSKNVEEAFQLGVRDRRAGKPPVTEDMIPQLSQGSELSQSMVRLAWEAYKAGYASAEGR